MSSSSGAFADDASAAAHLKVLRLQQQCTSAVQQVDVLTAERDVLARCLRCVAKLLSGFLSDVRAALAAKEVVIESSSSGVASSGSVEEQRPSQDIPPQLAAFLSHSGDGNGTTTSGEDGVAVAALHATKYLEDVLGSLLPFLLRCVRSSSTSSSSSSPSASTAAAPVRVEHDGGTTPDAGAASLSSDGAFRGSSNGSGHHETSQSTPRPVASADDSEERFANEHGRLSDRQIRAVVENIEYDRRVKLVLRMHQEVVLRLLRETTGHLLQPTTTSTESWLAATTNGGGGSSSLRRHNGLDDTLSPVTIPLASAHTSVMVGSAHDGWATLSTPPPLVLDTQNNSAVSAAARPEQHHRLQHTPAAAAASSWGRVPQYQEDSVDVDPPVESANSSMLSNDPPPQHREDPPDTLYTRHHHQHRYGEHHHLHHRHSDTIEGNDHVYVKQRQSTAITHSPDSSHSLESVLSELSGSEASRVGSSEGEVRHHVATHVTPSSTEDRCPARPRHRNDVPAASSPPPSAPTEADERGSVSGASTSVPGSVLRTHQRRLVSFGFDVVGINDVVDAGSLLFRPALRVVYVHHGTAADRYGVCPGDVLFKINERRTTTHDEFLRAVQELNREPSGTPVHLRVLRHDRLVQFFMIPDELSQELDSLAPTTQRPHSTAAATPDGRTPVRRDLLGSYPIAPPVFVTTPAERNTSTLSPSPRRRAHSPPPQVPVVLSASSTSFAASPRRGELQQGEHVLFHDTGMVGRLNKTLERLKEIQRQREELLAIKEGVGGHGPSTVSISGTSRRSVPTPAEAPVVSVSHSRLVHSHHLRATSPAFKATISPSQNLSPLRNGAVSSTSAVASSSPTRLSVRRRTPSPQEQRPWK